MLKSGAVLLSLLLSGLGSPGPPPTPPGVAPPPRGLVRPGEPPGFEAASWPAPDPARLWTSPPAWRPPPPGELSLTLTRPPAPLPVWLDRRLKHHAYAHGVDEGLVRAVLRQESGGDPAAVSPKGALGLMQLMPATARLLGVDPLDPEQNLAGGVKYLKLCLERFGRDPVLALAAYNAGPAAVEKYGGVPPYPETQHYVAAVLGRPPPAGRPGKARRGPPPPPAELASHQEAGLNWRLPKPAWKAPAPRVKVPAPAWKAPPPPAPGRSAALGR